MTEGKGPEQPLGQGMQPGPGPEHFAKFRIGEEEARQFPQPEFKSNLPDIKMEKGDDQEEDAMREWEMRMGRTLGPDLFGNFRRKIKDLEKPRTNKIAELSESLK